MRTILKLLLLFVWCTQCTGNFGFGRKQGRRDSITDSAKKKSRGDQLSSTFDRLLKVGSSAEENAVAQVGFIFGLSPTVEQDQVREMGIKLSALATSIANNCESDTKVNVSALVTRGSAADMVDEAFERFAQLRKASTLSVVKIFMTELQIVKLANAAVPTANRHPQPRDITNWQDAMRHRIWDFPKLFAPDLIPGLKQIIIVDLDTVIRVSIRSLWRQFLSMTRGHSSWMIGAVPEPHITILQHHADFSLRYVNTGVLLMRLDRLRKARWSQELLPDGIKEFVQTMQTGDQWPPEQWAFNSAFETYPDLLKVLDLRWNFNCNICDKGRDWCKRTRGQYILHYCGGTELHSFGLDANLHENDEGTIFEPKNIY